MTFTSEQIQRIKNKLDKAIYDELKDQVEYSELATYFRRADRPEDQDKEPTKEIHYKIFLKVE